MPTLLSVVFSCVLGAVRHVGWLVAGHTVLTDVTFDVPSMAKKKRLLCVGHVLSTLVG